MVRLESPLFLVILIHTQLTLIFRQEDLGGISLCRLFFSFLPSSPPGIQRLCNKLEGIWSIVLVSSLSCFLCASREGF